MLRTAQADGNLQGAFEQPLHDHARQPAHDRQIRNQGRELRTELSLDLVRQQRWRRASARATAQPMAAIFGDVRLDGWQFRDLMASRIPDGVARVQPMLAMPTRLGAKINGLIRPLGGHQWARMSGMSGLPTGLSSALRAATAFALATSETIGRGGLGRRRRVLQSQRELPFQVRNALGLLGDLAFTFGELTTQSLNLSLQTLLGVAQLLISFRHAAHGTPIGSTCTAP